MLVVCCLLFQCTLGTVHGTELIEKRSRKRTLFWSKFWRGFRPRDIFHWSRHTSLLISGERESAEREQRERAERESLIKNWLPVQEKVEISSSLSSNNGMEKVHNILKSGLGGNTSESPKIWVPILFLWAST